MRDEKRIDLILEQLKTIWKKYPDLRLGQLITNVIEGPALYYIEDEELIKRIRIMYNNEIEVK